MRYRSRGQNKIKTCRFESVPTRANPSGSIFLPTTFPNYENTRFLGHFGGGDGVRFRLPLIEQTVGSWSRMSGSLLRLAAPTYAGHNICGQMVSVPLHTPPTLSRYLPAPTPFPVHSISGLPSSCCIASERRPEPKKLGAPSTSARVLLPVGHPKNIPRLIQPPCAALINNVRSGSPLDSSTTCGVSALMTILRC